MKKILIISSNAIGDTYLSLSAAQEIKDIFIDVQIDFFIKPSSIFLFSELSFINNIIVYENIYDLISVKKFFLNKSYDYSLNFFPGRLNTLINLISGAKVKSGYWNISKKKNWDSSEQRVNSNFFRSDKFIWNKRDTYLNRINLIFQNINLPIKIDAKFKYSFIKEYNIYDEDYILMHTCSKDINRSLPENVINDLINFFREKFNKCIVFICNKDDRNYNYINSKKT